MMRSLKDSVFATLVGLEYQPQAKMLSLFVVTAVLFAYNKVVDLVERNRLFAVICGSYALVFVAIAVCLKSTSFGLYGDDGAPLPPSPERLLGWVHYFAIESYGSLAVSLFWQWTNSIVDLKAAKAQYGIIVAGGQIGAIAGCTLVVGSNTFGARRRAIRRRAILGANCPAPPPPLIGVAELYALGGLLTLVSPVIDHRRFPPPAAYAQDDEAAAAIAQPSAPRAASTRDAGPARGVGCCCCRTCSASSWCLCSSR